LIIPVISTYNNKINLGGDGMSDYPWFIIDITMAEIELLGITMRTAGEDPISVEIIKAQKNFAIALMETACLLETVKFRFGGRKGLIPSKIIKQIIQNVVNPPLAELEKVMADYGWSRIEGLKGDNPLAVDNPYRKGSQAEGEPQELFLKGEIIFRKDWDWEE